VRGQGTLYLLREQLWSRFARDESGRDDDVYIATLLHEELHLSLDEFFGHLLGIATLAGTLFFDIYLDEFGA